ncbi:hypothetical protein OIV83_006045 [Microbotryomycetes sp. JL201]|nr:hypothetical protein OIV83_006045 [Microbotryomycetes sp. JL201]
MAAEAAKLKGNAAFKDGNFELAVAHYTTAIQIDPSAYTYPLNRSLVYLKLGKAREAERDAATALKLEPNHPKAHFRLAEALKAQHRLASALEQYTLAKRNGAGADADAEIAALERQLPAATTRPDHEPSAETSSDEAMDRAGVSASAFSQLDYRQSAPPPSAPTSTSRLRAALSKQPSVHPDNTSSNGNGDLMKPVSSRRLSSDPKSNGTPSFTTLKQSRTDKGKSVTQLSSASCASSSSEPPRPSSSRPSTRTDEYPGGISGQMPLHADSSRQRREEDSPEAFPKPVPPPVTAILPPTTAHALELALLGTHDTAGRYNVLKSVAIKDLPSLLGQSLSPELLNHMLEALSCTNYPATQNSNAFDEEEAWKLAFVDALTRSSRFVMAAGLLEPAEKRVVQETINKARSRLDKLENIWFG